MASRSRSQTLEISICQINTALLVSVVTCRHIVFHPILDCVYVVNELSATLDHMAYNTANGQLSPQVAPFHPHTHPRTFTPSNHALTPSYNQGTVNMLPADYEAPTWSANFGRCLLLVVLCDECLTAFAGGLLMWLFIQVGVSCMPVIGARIDSVTVVLTASLCLQDTQFNCGLPA